MAMHFKDTVKGSISNNSGTATKLASARTITIGNKGNTFDGSANISYTLADIGAAASSHTHNYAGSSSAGGAANSVKTNLVIKLNGGSTEGTNLFTFNGSTAKTINITASSIGAVGSNHGTHVTYSTTAPKVAGTASAGSESAVARGDHVHAAQTSVSGNAGTATKLAAAKTITIGNAGKPFDGSANISYTLSEIGAAASGHTHTQINSRGSVTCESGVAGRPAVAGLSMSEAYSNGYPTPYGNIINLRGQGDGQILVGWAGSDGAHAPVYVRSKRDNVATANWSDWAQLYTTANKPTYSDVGAAAASHGTHVTYATAAPKANGTAAIGSVNRVAREDHVHPLQTSVSGNAGTATKLAAARSITIGNKANNFDGSGNISYSLAEIGAAPIQTKSAATAATAQWYRIATSAASINNCLGLFEIEAAVSGKHSVTLVSAGISYGVTNGVNLQQLSHTMYSTTGISKARIVYHTSYNSNYAYLEVYLPSATATTITVNLVGGRGWTLVAPSTVGSIPSGYTNKEITFQANKIVSNIQGSVSGNAGTATKLASKRTITIGNQGVEFDGSGNISFDLATIGAAATSHNHTSLTGITSLAFKAESSDAGSISTTIDSSNTYFDFNLSDDASANDMWRWRFTPSGGTVFNAMTLDPTSTTAAKLTVAGNITATSFTENGTALSSKYAAKSHGTHVGDAYATATPKANGTAAVGTSSKIAREDHVHPLQTSISGNAGSATILATARTITIGNKSNTFDGSANISYSIADIGAAPASHTHNYAGSSSAGGAANSVKTNLIIKLNGGSTEGTNLFTFNGGTAKTVNITPDNIGAAKSSHGDHVVWSTTAPKIAGTAAVGSETKVARGDHVHAAQTSVSGNAGTATKWKNAITLTIGNKGKSVDGSGNVKWTLTEIGASPLQKSVVSKATTDGKLTLSTDRYQKATLVTGNEIVLPTVSDFCEINLFVKDCSLANVILPDNCKWRVDPNLATGTSFIMTFIYTTQEWLAEIKVYS